MSYDKDVHRHIGTAHDDLYILPPGCFADDYSRPSFQIIHVVRKGEETFFAVGDELGYILTKRELNEIMDITQDFYKQVPVAKIEGLNKAIGQQQKRDHDAQHMVPEYVYLIKSGPNYKIGHSKNVTRRIKQLAQGASHKIELICTLRTKSACGLERILHKIFESQRLSGEWFELEDSDVEYIMSLQEGLNNVATD